MDYQSFLHKSVMHERREDIWDEAGEDVINRENRGMNLAGNNRRPRDPASLSHKTRHSSPNIALRPRERDFLFAAVLDCAD
jgi:hypothetical protein